MLVISALFKNSKRQKDGKTGPVICSLGAAADAQSPAVLLDNALAYPQTQPGALGIFGSEEGLKNSGQVFRRDSGTVVTYHDPDPGLKFRGTIAANTNGDFSG